MLLVYLVVQRKRNLAKRLPLGGKLSRSATDEGGYISAHYMKKSANISYSNRNDTWVVPPYSNVTFLPFLSGSEERRQAIAAGIRSTEYGYIRISTTKSKEQKSPCLKFLKVLRKLLLRSFLSRVWDSVPRS